MAKANQSRRPGARREPPEPEIPPFVRWFWREMMPLLRRRRRTSQSRTHLRNAAVEVLEAMRSMLDETIEWIKQDRSSAEFKRIRVED